MYFFVQSQKRRRTTESVVTALSPRKTEGPGSQCPRNRGPVQACFRADRVWASGLL